MQQASSYLQTLSDALTQLVTAAAEGVVALKAGAYRSASGVSIREDLAAVVDSSVRREERIPVAAADGSRGEGVLLGREPRLHLAFLKIEGIRLNPLLLSDASAWRSGTLATVVGLTTDAGASASIGTLGAVSGPRRTWRGGMLDRFVRLDANVYPSQTGAAVVDAQGRLIGMATPGLLQYSTVVLPAETLNRIADEILARGHVRYGYLGVGVQRVAVRTDGQGFGLIILSIEPASPAEKAGLIIGDVLLSLNGKPLTDIEQLQDVLTGDIVGREVEAVLSRGGEKLSRTLTVAERERKGR